MTILNKIKLGFKSLFTSPRILKFGIVGLSGVLVNMGVLYALTEQIGVFYLISSVIAIEASILSNFTLNNLWTWKDRKSGHVIHRVIRYHAAAGITAITVNWFLLLIFTEIAGVHYLLSNIIGIGCGMVSNFLLNDLWTFRTRE